VRGAARKPDVHLRIGVRISATQAHDCRLVGEALEHAVEHGPKIEWNNLDLHSQMGEVVLHQRGHLIRWVFEELLTIENSTGLPEGSSS